MGRVMGGEKTGKKDDRGGIGRFKKEKGVKPKRKNYR